MEDAAAATCWPSYLHDQLKDVRSTGRLFAEGERNTNRYVER